MLGPNKNEYVASCRPIPDRNHEGWRPANTVKLVLVIEQVYQEEAASRVCFSYGRSLGTLMEIVCWDFRPRWKV